MPKANQVLKDVSTINVTMLRKLALDASCDPRTIQAVINGRPVRGLAGDRAKAALTAAGYAVPPVRE